MMADYLWSDTRPVDHIDPGTRGTQPRPSFSRSLDSSSIISGRHHILNSTQPLVYTGTDWHAGSVHNQSNEPSSMTFASFPSHPTIPRSDSYEPPSIQTLPPTIEQPEELFDPFIGRSTRKKSLSFFARAKKRISRNTCEGSSTHDLVAMDIDHDKTEYTTPKRQHTRHDRRFYRRLEECDVSISPKVNTSDTNGF